MALKRIARVYLILGKTFNAWFSPLISGVMVLVLRMIVGIGRIFDHVIFWEIRKPLKDPIIIVGNPRSGTTFLHRFLIKENIGMSISNGFELKAAIKHFEGLDISINSKRYLRSKDGSTKRILETI